MTTAKVIKMTTDTQDTDTDAARAFGAIRALDALTMKLTAALKTATAEWTKTTTEATQAFRGPIREGDPKLTNKAAAALFFDAKKHLEVCDKTREEATADKKERAAKIAAVKEADAEVMSYAKKSGDTQLDAFAPGDANKIDGLGWCSPKTHTMVYTALTDLVADGVDLDDQQAPLLEALAKAGLNPIDLGLPASEAIEEDAVAPTDDGAEALANSDVPF